MLPIIIILILVVICASLLVLFITSEKCYNELLDKYIYYKYDKYSKAKELLEKAMKDMEILYETGKDEGCYGIKFKWRCLAEVKKLFKDDSIEEDFEPYEEPTLDNWISTKQELPKVHGEYLAVVNGKITQVLYNPTGYLKWSTCYSDGFTVLDESEITYWQYLPKLPTNSFRDNSIYDVKKENYEKFS